MDRTLLTEEFLRLYDKAIEAFEERKRVKAETGLKGNSYFPKHKFYYSNETYDTLAYETACKDLLDKRTAKEWRRKILGIKDEAMRNRCACLIWWSFFGRQTREGYSDVLDGYLTSEYVWIQPELVAMQLHRLGYSPYEAWQRAKLPKNNTQAAYREEKLKALPKKRTKEYHEISKRQSEDTGAIL